MANQISGKVLIIDDAISIPTRSGNTFTKRQIVLDASHYDPMTGQKFENYPAFDFVGNRVNELDNFKVGDLVTISFALNGRPFDKDGKTTYFTSVTGYKIEPYQRQNGGNQQLNGSQTNNPTQPSSQQATGVQNSPQRNEPFPPPVDESGNVEQDQDLPF